MNRVAIAVFRLALAGACGALSQAAFAQSITTYAGGGVEDGRLATDLAAYGPRGVALDKSGNVYFAEAAAGRVRRVDAATGRITTIAGTGASGFSGDGGLATSAALRQPRGLVVDADGNVFVADHDNDRVRRIDAASGVITTFAGGAQLQQGIGDGDVATKASFDGPWGLVLSGGALFVSEDGFRGNRVRRIDLTTKIITTFAGDAGGLPGDTGDGAAARDAKLNQPLGLAADANGNIFVADSANGRVRRIDVATNTIRTYAGGGTSTDSSGIAATNAKLDFPTVLAFDRKGNLVIASDLRLRRVDKTSGIISDTANPQTLIYGLAFDGSRYGYFEDEAYNVIRRFDEETGEITTRAGGGSYIGDGLLATGAILHEPLGLATNKAGDLFIADAANNVIRKIDAATRVVTSVAGIVGLFYAEPQEGNDATNAVIGGPRDVAVDSAGNVYIADGHNLRVWRVDAAGKIATYAGGGNTLGDNGPATAALLRPEALAFDAADNLYVADPEANRVRRIDAKTRIITTVAGNGQAGFSGDGGAATAATLDAPRGLAVNAAGDLFIADMNNYAVRKVDAVSHNISLWAGRGSTDGIGDGGAPTATFIGVTRLAIERATQDLLLVDGNTHRVRRISADGAKITTFAGSGPPGDFAGDNGPAARAKLNFGYDLGGLAVAPNGDIYIADTDNNRVRAVFACGAISAAVLQSPAENATTTTAPQLTWSAPSRAFRYDVLLDTVNPPAKVAASDLTEPAFTPSNLAVATKYYWRVVAKGDLFCTPAATALSAVASFTTNGRCSAAPFSTTAPANDATNVASPVQLTWQASAGASTYDVYLGTTNPPSLLAQNVSATSYSATVSSGRNYWYVVAHASCDRTETTSTPLQTFTAADAPCNGPVTSVQIVSPANGASSIALDVELTWQATGRLDGFDLYFGDTANPPLLATALAGTSQTVSGLRPATKYYWRVARRDLCSNGASSPTVSFTTRACDAPGATTIVFAPASVSAGATYSIVWSAASGSDADAAYVVERARNASFNDVETQVLSSTAATFVADATGTYYHRVRAVAGCDVTRLGAPSAVAAVTALTARPNVVFAVQPSAVITSLGEKLEERRTTFTLENLGASALQVIVGRQELNGSQPFFSIVDPLGQDVAFITLEPHTPKPFVIRYAGPRNDTAGSYQGVIFVASTGGGLAVTPYAFVNLKVGGGVSATPRFTIDGVATEYASFAPFGGGDDSTRAALQVGVRNDGNEPMEVGFDIGPEVWLTTDGTWNATPIPPQATRTVNLLTRRGRAPNGSALPRYTWLTVRTKDGASSRLLVQDNDAVAVANGRASRLDVGARSFLVPEAISTTSPRGARLATRVRLSNVGSDAVQAELIFTPSGADGFDPTLVRRATVVVPPNDVVTISDPLSQLFGVARPASGQLEVRLPRERIGLVAISATTGIAGGSGFGVPVVNRGDGARLSSAHALPAITKSSSVTTAVVLAETSGNDHAAGRIVLTSAAGARLGEKMFDIPRYGYVRYDDVVAIAGANAADNARATVTVESGGGSVAAVAIVSTNNSDGGAAVLSRPLSDTVSAFAGTMRLRNSANSTFTVTTVVPVVPSAAYATAIGLTASPTDATTFMLTFRGATTLVKEVSLAAGTTKIFPNVLTDVFALAPSATGSVFVDAPPTSRVQALLQAVSAPTAAPSSFVPLPTTLSEALTSAGASARRPLFFDGLEQSIDPTRGARWTILLNEVAGSSGSVDVLLYEAGNRASPIAGGTIAIAPFQQLQLSTIFSTLGLDSALRRKDRTNMQCVVIARGGNARVAATAVSVDNVSGETKAFALAPVAGSASPSTSIVEPVLPRITIPGGRRRVAGH
jgi:sugar lactone lactonase YvrE